MDSIHVASTWRNAGAIWPILGDLAVFFRCLRYNLRIVTDTAIVGPRTLATAGAQSYGTLGAVGTVGVPVHATKRAYVTTPMIKGG